MATITRTYLVDDLDGSEEGISNVRLSLDKKDYEIDLSAANEARLRDKLARFLAAAVPVRSPRARQGRKATGSAPVGREQAQAVRDWAHSQGLAVSERGRISAAVQQAFDESH